MDKPSEVGEAWEARKLHRRRTRESSRYSVEQRTQNPWPRLIELRPELLFLAPMFVVDDGQRHEHGPVDEV